jgi:endoribonuclease Dicer
VSSSGDGWSSKLGAKQVAQFEVVRRLLENGEIDGFLNPSPSRVPAGQAGRGSESNKPAEELSISRDRARSDRGTLPNAPPSLNTRQQWDALKAKVQPRLPAISPPLASGSGIAAYNHITTPSFWVDSPPLSRHEVHATLLELRLAEPHTTRNEECRMLCMISSRPLPIFAGGEEPVDIDVSQADSQGRPRVEAVMRLRDGGKMKKWEKGQVEMAIRWTVRMMRAQLNQAFSIEERTAKWAIVPLVRSFKRPELHKRPNLRRRDIAWDEVEAGDGPFSFPFELSDLDTLQSQVDDAMISTRAEFSRRYYIQTIRTDLSPSSPDPHTPGETLLSTVKTYGIAVPTVRSLEHPSQPILQCELSTPAKSGGFVAGVSQSGMTGHLFIPELQHRHVLSASAFRTASALPALFLALDDILIAREMDDTIFGSALRPGLALQALTCPSVTPLAVEKSYQRLEMLGDTLLKLVSTIDMYIKVGGCPGKGIAPGGVDLETLHADRHVLVSNRSLMANAIEAGVVPFIRSAPHRLKLWIPNGWAVEIGTESDGRKATDKQHLGDKVGSSWSAAFCSGWVQAHRHRS